MSLVTSSAAAEDAGNASAKAKQLTPNKSKSFPPRSQVLPPTPQSQSKRRATTHNVTYVDIDIDIDSDASPPPSVAGHSSSDDQGSVYAPLSPTPLRTFANGRDDEQLSFSDLEEEDQADTKPSLSLVHPSLAPKPGAACDNTATATETKTNSNSNKSRSRSKRKATRTSSDEEEIKPSPSASRKRPSGGIGKAAPRAWSGEEDWEMFRQLHPKVAKPDWAGVARQVGNGRDAKSCQNRYATLSKKLEGAIKGAGGP